MENENSVATNMERVAVIGDDAAGAVAVARILAGLQEGRIVNYVMNDGAIRPLIVVNAWDRSGQVNGVLLFDGTNDNGKFPQPLTPGSSGHLPMCATWVTSAHYDDSETPALGTWHWPSKQPVVAAAVDPAAIDTQIAAAIARVIDKTVNAVYDTFNDKLQTHLVATNALIESAIAELKGPPVPSCDQANPVPTGYVAQFGIEPMSGVDLDEATTTEPEPAESPAGATEPISPESAS